VKIAVIPARGGSKRIPGKNIRPFAGKPIIGWSIDAALPRGNPDSSIASSYQRTAVKSPRWPSSMVPRCLS
jgi:N-acylneuraminate cytidylyltransferase